MEKLNQLWLPEGGCGARGAGLFLLLALPGLAEREELPLVGVASAPAVSAGRVMLYHGWVATTVGGTALPSCSSSYSSPFSSSSSNGLEVCGGVLDLEPSPWREDREPVFGGVVSPAWGGGGAFFFLVSDGTRVSQGGSLGLWGPLNSETHRQWWRRGGHTEENHRIHPYVGVGETVRM